MEEIQRILDGVEFLEGIKTRAIKKVDSSEGFKGRKVISTGSM